MFEQVGGPAKSKGREFNFVRVAGILAVVIGLVICAGFTLLYDPTVTTMGGEQIANIMALNRLQNGILGGLLLAIFGALLLLYSKQP